MKKKFKNNDDLSETNMLKPASASTGNNNREVTYFDLCKIEMPKDTYVTIGHRTYKATNDQEFEILARRSFGGRDVESTYYPRVRYSRGSRLFANLTGNTEMINQIAAADEYAYMEQSESHLLKKMKRRKK